MNLILSGFHIHGGVALRGMALVMSLSADRLRKAKHLTPTTLKQTLGVEMDGLSTGFVCHVSVASLPRHDLIPLRRCWCWT